MIWLISLPKRNPRSSTCYQGGQVNWTLRHVLLFMTPARDRHEKTKKNTCGHASTHTHKHTHAHILSLSPSHRTVSHPLDNLLNPDGDIHRQHLSFGSLKIASPCRGLQQLPQSLDSHGSPPSTGRVCSVQRLLLLLRD